MAFYTNHISHRDTSLVSWAFDKTGQLLEQLTFRATQSIRARRTYEALSRLNDRELEDIGLHRSALKGLSIEAARNAR